MIWILRDYLRYREQSANYRNDPSADIMAAGFVGNRLERIVPVLPPGTILLVKTMGSRLAWTVLYFTNSTVSHVATYIGSGMILHATTAGSRYEPVNVLYGTENRILPFAPRFSFPSQALDPKTYSDLIGKPYPWVMTAVKALRILFSVDESGFRWQFAYDVFFTATLCEVLLWRIANIVTFAPVLFAFFYLFVVLSFRLRHKLCGKAESFWDFTPGKWLDLMFEDRRFEMVMDSERLTEWREDLIVLATKQGLFTMEEASEFRTKIQQRESQFSAN